LGLGIASGILLALPSRFPILGPLAHVSLVPWILLCTHPKLRERGVVSAGLAGSFAFYLVALTWLFSFGTPVGVACIFLSPIIILPFVLALRRAWRRWRWPATFLVPVVWVGWEILRPNFLPAGWALPLLGQTQARYIQMIQIADMFGVAGVSFLVAMTNGAIVDLIYRLVPTEGVAPLPRRGLQVALGSFVAVFLLTWGYGVYRLGQESLSPGPKLALIQPAVPHNQHDPDVTREGSRLQAAFTISQVPPDAVDMVVWPENAIMDDLGRDPQYMRDIRRVVRATRADLLVSAFRLVPDDPDTGFNSVFHFDPRGRMLAFYDKVRLIPLAEHLPLERQVEWLGPGAHRLYRRLAKNLIGWDSIGKPGEDGVIVFTLETKQGSWRFGAPTCYENTDPLVARQAVRRGAQFLVNMTSEGTLGPLASRQYYIISVFRAVEHRIGIARCGNVGITGFIDSRGLPQKTLADPQGNALYFKPGVLIDNVALDSRTGTWFTLLGKWPAYGLSILTALLLTTSWARGRSAVTAARATQATRNRTRRRRLRNRPQADLQSRRKIQRAKPKASRPSRR